MNCPTCKSAAVGPCPFPGGPTECGHCHQRRTVAYLCRSCHTVFCRSCIFQTNTLRGLIIFVMVLLLLCFLAWYKLMGVIDGPE